jgi:hypothetical protein
VRGLSPTGRIAISGPEIGPPRDFAGRKPWERLFKKMAGCADYPAMGLPGTETER